MLVNFFRVQNEAVMKAKVWRGRDNELHENGGWIVEKPLCQRL
jgi:hypothetical protein